MTSQVEASTSPGTRPLAESVEIKQSRYFRATPRLRESLRGAMSASIKIPSQTLSRLHQGPTRPVRSVVDYSELNSQNGVGVGRPVPGKAGGAQKDLRSHEYSRPDANFQTKPTACSDTKTVRWEV